VCLASLPKEDPEAKIDLADLLWLKSNIVFDSSRPFYFSVVSRVPGAFPSDGPSLALGLRFASASLRCARPPPCPGSLNGHRRFGKEEEASLHIEGSGGWAHFTPDGG
jgi:hypothetical protein